MEEYFQVRVFVPVHGSGPDPYVQHVSENIHYSFIEFQRVLVIQLFVRPVVIMEVFV